MTMYDDLPDVPEFQRLLHAAPWLGVRLTCEEVNEVVGIITSLMGEVWELRESASRIAALEARVAELEDVIEYAWDFSGSPQLIEKRILLTIPDIGKRED